MFLLFDLLSVFFRTYRLKSRFPVRLKHKNVRVFFIWISMLYNQKKLLSKKLAEKFREFITNHPPSKFSRHLRCLFFDYLQEQSKKDLPVDFDIYVWELYDLFDLLDCATDEWEHPKEKNN